MRGPPRRPSCSSACAPTSPASCSASPTSFAGPPFSVLATQNPYEFEGTSPLPESQLDRFLMRLRVGYPDRTAEKAILTGHRSGEPIDRLQSVLCAREVAELQWAVRQVRVEDS